MEAINIYIYLLAIGILLAGLISAKVNKVSYFYKPRFKFAKFYLKYAKVGGYQVASALIVPGILVIANWFYPIAVIGLVNGILKIFIIYKGGLRIIIQAFFKEIAIEKTDEKIDKASLLVWGAFSIPIIVFDTTTLNLLFDDKLNEIAWMMPVFGLIMFFAAFRNAAEIRVLMLKKDNLNLIVFLTALAMQIVALVAFSYTEYFMWGIPAGLLVAEIIVVAGLGYGLDKYDYYVKRFKFVFQILPPILLAVLIKWFFGPSWPMMIAAVLIYSFWALMFFRKLIFEKLNSK